jgi:hypothetical protein
MEAQVDKRDETDPGSMGGFVRIRGAREHNLADVSLEIPPRNCGLHRRLRIRKVVTGLRNAVRGGPTALP